VKSIVLSVVGASLLAGACGGSRPAGLPETSASPSTAAIDSAWGRGERAFRSGKWSTAQRELDRVAAGIPSTDPRYQQLHFYLGEVLLAQGQHLLAVREFRRVADERPEDRLAPDALVRAGDAYAELWRRPELDPTYGESARSVYQEVLTRYPGSQGARRATIQLAALAEQFAAKEYKNALFYYRYKAYDSAILLFRSLLAQYPRANVAPLALEKLVRSYQILNYAEDLRETCGYIAEYYPDPAGPRRLCAAVSVVDSSGTEPEPR
jgi:outer membrane protein assembly factor BamD